MKDSRCVSVVIPTYNRASMLPRAIESVLAQTYKNVEIMIVDDGSTDNTQAVLDGYRDRIRCIRIENQGASHARNVGMQESRGKYIAFLDSDDAYYPNKLSIQVDWMERHPEVGMISSEFSAVHEDGTIQENHLRQYHRIYDIHDWAFDDLYPEHEDVFIRNLGKTVKYYSGNLFEFAIMGPLIVSNTILFRREVLDVVGYQNEHYRFAEDYDFVLRICKYFRVGFVDIPTYMLFYHDGQISQLCREKSDDREKDNLLKIEGLNVFLAAVEDAAFRDKDYYRMHRKEIDFRMAELISEIGDMWCDCGNYQIGRQYLRKSYQLRNKSLPMIRSYIMPLFPEKYKLLIRKMRGALRSSTSSRH